MTSNQLGTETSPYLLQHKDNPVHWRPWGKAALTEAGETGKPILLSVGYAACHWCHVMAHESFEDQATADVMNALFVNIKVDREERPDVDQLYMSALHELGEQGGWPLTMFLTSAGEPFWGGTYFPKEPAYGRPSFVQILTEIARIYTEEPTKVEQNRTAILSNLKSQPAEDQPGLTAETIANAATQLAGFMDPVHGGIRRAPKFPQASFLHFLLHAGARTGDPQFSGLVDLTLERIARGGIWDHLGGGLARYSVDARWHVPHFEKMLYDNAQLIELFAGAWLRTGNILFRDRIEETVIWLKTDLLMPGGAFAASLDADSEGEEGKYYVWSLIEILDILGSDDGQFFAEAYDVTAEGNWEGTNVINRLHDPFPLDADTETRLADCRQTLLKVRQGRIPPGRDHKILADWNGLLIAALAQSAMVFGRPEHLELAKSAYQFVCESMWIDGVLAHSLCDGKLVTPGMATDYANMIRAALRLYQTTTNATYLEMASAWKAKLIADYRDDGAGDYHLSSVSAPDMITRLKSIQDDATPSASAVMARNHLELWVLTGDSTQRGSADAIISALAARTQANPFAYLGILSALDMRLDPLQIVVVGPSQDPHARALIDAAWRIPDPNRLVMSVEDTGTLAVDHPARGKIMVDSKPAAYICSGTTCSLPVTDPNRIAETAVRTP